MMSPVQTPDGRVTAMIWSDYSEEALIRFNPDGTVKSYSFSSNFPEDMQRLK